MGVLRASKGHAQPTTLPPDGAGSRREELSHPGVDSDVLPFTFFAVILVLSSCV